MCPVVSLIRDADADALATTQPHDCELHPLKAARLQLRAIERGHARVGNARRGDVHPDDDDEPWLPGPQPPESRLRVVQSAGLPLRWCAMFADRRGGWERANERPTRPCNGGWGDTQRPRSRSFQNSPWRGAREYIFTEWCADEIPFVCGCCVCGALCAGAIFCFHDGSPTHTHTATKKNRPPVVLGRAA